LFDVGGSTIANSFSRRRILKFVPPSPFYSLLTGLLSSRAVPSRLPVFLPLAMSVNVPLTEPFWFSLGAGYLDNFLCVFPFCDSTTVPRLLTLISCELRLLQVWFHRPYCPSVICLVFRSHLVAFTPRGRLVVFSVVSRDCIR